MPANLTKIQDQGVDLSDTYVSLNDVNLIYDSGYLSKSGQDALGIDYGKLFTWGYNRSYALGLGDLAHRSSPTQVGSLKNWKHICISKGSSFALKKDGTIYNWGDNVGGSVPVQIGTGTTYNYINSNMPNSYSGISYFAIKTDGTLWAWGDNAVGQLGLGNTTTQGTPVQVGTLTNWKSVVCVAAAYSSAAVLAVKTDGTLWAWGWNGIGQLGLGDLTNRSSPVQVGTLTNWKQVSPSSYSMGVSAVKTDGTLWAWGRNDNGELGLGDRVHRSSPVQVGTLTNWATGWNGVSTTGAIKTDGTLWMWGSNASGQLGLGDLTNRSSPVQVGALTNWKSVTVGWDTHFAIKTDGTLWGWGADRTGSRGGLPSTSSSSPTQLGTSNTWKTVWAGFEATAGIN